ncbi:DUF3237 family protein [Brevundimonas sp.]|uniref:DUF3237 family protein n=1 Tax=Brevundimonas sp. TaxID=1871086 RepID=UPI003D104985
MTGEAIFTVRISLGPPVDIGAVPGGFRRVIPILGGTFSGEGLHGRVLESGADWQLIRPEGHIDLDARYVLETEEAERIYISNIGRRFLTPEACADLVAGRPVDQSGATSRGLTTMESGAMRFRWLNEEKFRPRGKRGPDGIEIGFYRLATSDAGDHPWS